MKTHLNRPIEILYFLRAGDFKKILKYIQKFFELPTIHHLQAFEGERDSLSTKSRNILLLLLDHQLLGNLLFAFISYEKTKRG